MRRLVLLAALAVVAAGCGDSLPGGKVVTPTPVTVIATKISTPWLNGTAAVGATEFNADSCAACHTFAAAHSKGIVGPNLDKLETYFRTQGGGVGTLQEFIYNSIVDPSGRVVPGYTPGLMPPDGGHKLSSAQVADLVAFLAAQAS